MNQTRCGGGLVEEEKKKKKRRHQRRRKKEKSFVFSSSGATIGAIETDLSGKAKIDLYEGQTH